MELDDYAKQLAEQVGTAINDSVQESASVAAAIERLREAGYDLELTLRLEIGLRPHRLFTVEGRDLTLTLPVAPWEAALGAEIEVPTLEGAVRMKVPAGAKSGQKLRLAGKGLPRPSGGAGDLYAMLNIVVPPAASERQQKLYEELGTASKFDPRSRLKR